MSRAFLSVQNLYEKIKVIDLIYKQSSSCQNKFLESDCISYWCISFCHNSSATTCADRTRSQKPSPCDGSLQQDTGRVKQITTYEYHSRHKIHSRPLRLVLVITSTINTHWFKTFSTHEIWVFRQYIKHISHEMLYIISDRAFTANTLIAVALFSKRIVRSIELKHFL